MDLACFETNFAQIDGSSMHDIQVPKPNVFAWKESSRSTTFLPCSLLYCATQILSTDD